LFDAAADLAGEKGKSAHLQQAEFSATLSMALPKLNASIEIADFVSINFQTAPRVMRQAIRLVPSIVWSQP
jgi:hypothetical protein